MSNVYSVVDQDKNLAAQFYRVTEDFQTFPAVISEAATITYGQLLAASIGFAKRFQLAGVNQRSTVALNTGDTPAVLATLLATSLLGCRLVTASEVLRRQGIIKPTHFFKTSDAKGKSGVGFIEIERSWFHDAAEVDISDIQLFPGYTNADDIWQILHTSGTTGKPKFIGLTHRIVTERTAAISGDFPTAQTTCAMLFNCTSRPFFARAIGALLNACTIVDSNDAQFWQRCGVNTVFCSPSQYQSFVDKYGVPPRFKKVEISGAKLEDDMVRLLAQSFDKIVDIYGASETNKTFSNLVDVNPLNAVTRAGQPLDSEVEIVGDNGLPRIAGESGTVRVKNPYMAGGYIQAPESTARNFVDGWFYPGDIGRFGSNGELEILGRNDEVISFGGIKIDAELIDLIIRSVEGVEDAICFKSPKAKRNEVIAFVVFAPCVDQATCIAGIREAYQGSTGLPCFLGPIHEIDKIPYTDTGRPMRELCQQIIRERSGEIEAAAG